MPIDQLRQETASILGRMLAMKAIIRGLRVWIYSRRLMPFRPFVMMPVASTLRLIQHTTSPPPAYEHHDPMSPQTTSSTFAAFHGLPANATTTNPGIFNNSDPRMAYQRSEMHHQSRGNHGYQQAEMPLHSTLPSEDSTRNLLGPR
jgi:hypothetical protein